MITRTLIATAIVLALSACDESTTSPQIPVNDPQVPDVDPPVQPPIIPPVEEIPTTPGFDINAMLNGSSETDFSSFWKCSDVGETNPDAYYTMRFYADASGVYGGGGNSIEYTWAATDNNIDMVFPGDARNLRFANIVFENERLITTNFEVTNEATEAVNCELTDMDSTVEEPPVIPVDDDPTTEEPVIEEPIVVIPTDTSFDINTMLNGPSQDNYVDFWKCSDVGETDPDAYFSMRFYADASGAYGGGGTVIEYSWSATDNNIDMVFPNDSRNLRFANITFQSDGLFVTDFEVTGETTSALNCNLLDTDGNPVY